MPTEIRNPSEVIDIAKRLSNVMLSRVFLRSVRRNAWHSTMIQYHKFSCKEYAHQEAAENTRAQGTVIEIEVLPMIVLMQGTTQLGVSPRDELPRRTYGILSARIKRTKLQNSWAGILMSQAASFYFLSLDVDETLDDFRPELVRAGSKKDEWYYDNNPRQFQHFVRFARHVEEAFAK